MVVIILLLRTSSHTAASSDGKSEYRVGKGAKSVYMTMRDLSTDLKSMSTILFVSRLRLGDKK